MVSATPELPIITSRLALTYSCISPEDESSKRLGWVEAVSVSRPLVDDILALRDKLRAAGVNHIVLGILPRLKPGVIVHVHDIFIPYEYPRQWPEKFGLYWTEQYLVHAFLIYNSGFEILAAMHALQRDRRDAMAELLPPAVADWPGGAFWMRRTAG